MLALQTDSTLPNFKKRQEQQSSHVCIDQRIDTRQSGIYLLSKCTNFTRLAVVDCQLDTARVDYQLQPRPHS